MLACRWTTKRLALEVVDGSDGGFEGGKFEYDFGISGHKMKICASIEGDLDIYRRMFI